MPNNILSSIKRWLNLGFDDTQWQVYSKSPQHLSSLAERNIAAVCPDSAFSIFIAIIIFAAHGAFFGPSVTDAFPLAVAVVSFGLIALFDTSSVAKGDELRTSYMLTGAFSITWYALAIWFDVFIQPSEMSVITALVFLTMPAAFDARPKDIVVSTAVAYLCFAVADLAFATHGAFTPDFANVLVAGIVGVRLSQKRTSGDAASLLYLDMYKTATKATLLVGQLDLRKNTFEAMQLPSYVEEAVAQCRTATDALELVGLKYLSPNFYEQYRGLFDLETLPDRLGEDGRANFVYQNFQGLWRQLIITEQSRIDGEVNAVVVVVHDIDFVKRQELAYQEKLREKALEAERANAAKTTFLRRMSHDVRTPLNGIKGVIDMADSCPEDIERQAELRGKAREATGYLLSLVNSILDLNKLESGAIMLEHKPFDLIALLDEANSITETQATERGLAFGFGSTRGDIRHTHLVGSPVHLQQVLLNLATNAVKYNREGGSITVSCRELGCTGGSAEFEFVCADTGIGMSEEFQRRAFEPFTQEDSKPHSSFSGAGLGLSIVHEMVESMGGTITLKSEQGKGSTFTVHLPFEIDANPAQEPEPEEIGHALAGKRALLVEDNELNREIAEFALSGLGMSVVCAANGREALARFAESEPGEFDVVLMDVMMPVMDGLAAARQIRSLEREDAQAVPIIAMTANAFHDDEVRSRDAGMNAHLSKPLDTGELARTIQRLTAEK